MPPRALLRLRQARALVRALALVLVPGLGLLLATLAAGCASAGPPPPDPMDVEYHPSLGVDLEAMERRDSGLLVRDLSVGAGPEASAGSEVRMHYIGSFPDGTVFDSSLVDGEPIRFRLGDDEVIEGWDEGIVGMREGGQRMLIVPPALGYGRRGIEGAVPGNQVLVFEIQLVEVR